jgi:hypothetical protein
VVEGQQVWLSRVLDGAAGLEAGGQLPLCSMTWMSFPGVEGVTEFECALEP